MLSGMLKGQRRQPAPVRHSPRRPTTMLATMAQEKALKVLAGSRHDLSDDTTQPYQIAHGFMIDVRHPDRR